MSNVVQFPGKKVGPLATIDTPLSSIEKRAIFLAQMERGETYVRFNPNVPGVQVPPHLAPQLGPLVLVLKFSYQYKPSDVELTDEGVAQTLSFQGNFFRCAQPSERDFR